MGEQHPDRDAQFRFINETSSKFLGNGEPVISIDTKKKENIGNFKNNGAEYRPVKDPKKVLVKNLFFLFRLELKNGSLSKINSDRPEFSSETPRSFLFFASCSIGLHHPTVTVQMVLLVQNGTCGTDTI